MPSPLTIRPVETASDREKFIRLPWKIYKDDPAWVPPLLKERREFLDPKKNPYFQHADVVLFLAEKDGEPVGRISAQVDRLHNDTHKEQTGFFGLFECIDDADVAHCLLNNAAGWLKSRGMTSMRGPFCFSMNEDAGVAVKGREYPPFIMMAHSTPYYERLLETCGLKKLKDLYCWRYDSARPVPEAARQLAEEARKHPGLVIREVDPKNIERDVRILIDVFNSAWEKNWGFVPMTENEIKKAAKDFKLLLEPKLALIAEVNGVPAGISLALPNLNEAIKDLNGRLFPFGLFKLLYRLKRKKIRSARLMLLGIKKEFRKDALGAGLSVLLYVEKHRRSQELKHWGGELSWTLEDNQKINFGIEMMGGEHYKTYRVYEKSLENAHAGHADECG
ncbi:MAG TPA: N-acetyltransferase [bacterium]|nr:N-acetyltransferase [bacterium]